jgi:hypothetical protein
VKTGRFPFLHLVVLVELFQAAAMEAEAVAAVEPLGALVAPEAQLQT